MQRSLISGSVFLCFSAHFFADCIGVMRIPLFKNCRVWGIIHNGNNQSKKLEGYGLMRSFRGGVHPLSEIHEGKRFTENEVRMRSVAGWVTPRMRPPCRCLRSNMQKFGASAGFS